MRLRAVGRSACCVLSVRENVVISHVHNDGSATRSWFINQTSLITPAQSLSAQEAGGG